VVRSSAASDVYKRQIKNCLFRIHFAIDFCTILSGLPSISGLAEKFFLYPI
jgi:hypothetical protein